MFDPMADLADTSATSEDPLSPSASSQYDAPRPSSRPPRDRGDRDGGSYASELHSVRINGGQRTFYLDLKESSKGKFFKLSEKSRGGRKVTIMFDVEDLPKFMDAFNEMQSKI